MGVSLITILGPPNYGGASIRGGACNRQNTVGKVAGTTLLAYPSHKTMVCARIIVVKDVLHR